MAVIGRVYRKNDKSKREVVLIKEANGGREFLVESNVNRRRDYIPARDIHDGPYASGWSLVPKEEYADARISKAA